MFHITSRNDSIPSEGISELFMIVPCVQKLFFGIVVYHRIVSILVRELYIGVPLITSLCVIGKVDGCGIAIITVNAVDHSTSYEGVTHRVHTFCDNNQHKEITCKINCLSSVIQSNFD